MAIKATYASYQLSPDVIVPSPNGHTLLVGTTIDHQDQNATDEGMAIRLVDLATGREIRYFKGHVFRGINPRERVPITRHTIINALSLAFSPDGKQFVSGGDDHVARIWDVATGKELRAFSSHAAIVEHVVYSADGCRVLSIDRDNVACWWDSETGRELRRFEVTGWIRKAVATSEGIRIVAVNPEECLVLFDGETGARLQSFAGHTDQIVGASIARDGRWIASCGADSTIRLWDTQTGREVRRLSGKTNLVDFVEFSPDGRFLLGTAGDDNANLRLWETSTGRMVVAFTTPVEDHRLRPLFSLAFSIDGKFAFTNSLNCDVFVWRLPISR